MKNKLYIFLILVVSLFVILSFSSFAADEPSVSDSPAVPTDLTGYTVYVPYDWTCFSNYGSFNIQGYYAGDYFYSIRVGYEYTDTLEERTDRILFSLSDHVAWFESINPSDGFTIIIEGGSDVTNTRFIDWLVSNDAEFTAPEAPPVEPPVDPPSGSNVLESVLSLFLAVSTWLGQAVGVIISMFWTGSELTFVGVLSVAGLAFSVSFLIIALISRFIRFGG